MAEQQPTSRPYFLLLALGVVATALGTVGAWLYERETGRIRAQEVEELESIAKLKVGQVISWRDERLMDAAFGARGPFFVAALREWQGGALTDPNLRSSYESRLANYLEMLRYESALLVSPDGAVALAGTGGSREIAPAEIAALPEAAANRGAVTSDFFLLEGHGARLSAIAPVYDGARLAGFLVLRRDPEHVLFPMLREWPAPSPSAETIIVRQQDDEMVFITGMRHRPTPPLSLRIPMSDDSVAGVRAVKLGRAVTLEGRDYRGVKVIARAELVPGTDWVLGAKLDLDEILAEARYRGIAILGFALLGTLLAALGVAVLYNRRQQRLYRELYEAEQQRRREEDEFRTTVYSVGDGVITTDVQGRVRRMNPAAEAMCGWTESAAHGRPLADVFRTLDEASGAPVESPADRVLRLGEGTGHVNHTVLVARDGQRRVITTSGALIRDGDDAARGVVIVFRDESERRRHERELENALELASTRKQRLRGVVDATTDLMAAIDTDYRYITFNKA